MQKLALIFVVYPEHAFQKANILYNESKHNILAYQGKANNKDEFCMPS